MGPRRFQESVFQIPYKTFSITGGGNEMSPLY